MSRHTKQIAYCLFSTMTSGSSSSTNRKRGYAYIKAVTSQNPTPARLIIKPIPRPVPTPNNGPNTGANEPPGNIPGSKTRSARGAEIKKPSGGPRRAIIKTTENTLPCNSGGDLTLDFQIRLVVEFEPAAS